VVPDLGEGFVEACLDIYNGNVELVIDALFADDLHPALKALDRRMQKVWIGKQDKEPEFLQKPGHPSASASASASSRSITKERVRLMERKQEWDSYILSKEYDDDYDDQVRSQLWF
jgi:activating signal cointegrator complex subunit 2